MHSHFLQLWLFNDPLSLGCLTSPKACKVLKMQINLGSFICSLCSVLCSIVRQRILGLFLLQNLYLQPFVQSAEFKTHESALEPVVTGGPFLSDALCTSINTWNCITSFPTSASGKEVMICSSHKLLLQHSHTEFLSDCIYSSQNNITI